MNNLNDKRIKFDKPVKVNAYHGNGAKQNSKDTNDLPYANIEINPGKRNLSEKQFRILSVILCLFLVLVIFVVAIPALLNPTEEPNSIDNPTEGMISINMIQTGETMMGGEPADYAYVEVTASVLQKTSDQEYAKFVNAAMDEYSDVVWITIIIDQAYSIQYIPGMPDALYYGLSDDEGKVQYGVEVSAGAEFSLKEFLTNVDKYNNEVARNKKKAEEISKQQRQEILSAIDQQLESLVKSADGTILAAKYVSDNSYEVFVSDAWYLSTEQAKESFANAVLLRVQNINSKYIGDGYVALHIYDKNRIPVARDSVWSGMKVLN